MVESLADSNRKKASRGTVAIGALRGSLFLRWQHAGKRHTLYLGLPDSLVNRQVAQNKVNTIEWDIRSGHFDDSLKRYKPVSSLSTSTPIPTPKLLLKDLWAQYMEYRSPQASPKTINSTYAPVSAHIDRCNIDGLEDALSFRKEILKVTTQAQARRTLMQLSAACKWGIQHRLIENNPFEGMYNELSKDKPAPPMAFSVEERDAIIAAFETHQGSGIRYAHYAPFVQFLFWTGCRPCEAIGLRWGSTTPDCGRVHFYESIVEVSGKLIRRQETKTGVKRWFSCPSRLQEMLLSIRPEDVNQDALVFPSPRSKPISISNFSQRAWKTILEGIGLHQKDGLTMTPYNCRDTFITLQAMSGNSSTTIARWCGNSAQVIETKYLDKLKLAHLKPTDI